MEVFWHSGALQIGLLLLLLVTAGFWETLSNRPYTGICPCTMLADFRVLDGCSDEVPSKSCIWPCGWSIDWLTFPLTYSPGPTRGAAADHVEEIVWLSRLRDWKDVPSVKNCVPLIPKDSLLEQVEEATSGRTGQPRITWKTGMMVLRTILD